MSAEVGMRARSAVRAAVRWMALLLLLQCLGSHPSFTAAGEYKHVVVKIKKYFSFPHSEFRESYGNQVDYGVSWSVCQINGGALTADQTPAAHQSITDYLRRVRGIADAEVFTYMGGNAYYSFFWEENPKRVCNPEDGNTLLNCIFEWNQGLFEDASAKPKPRGVPFFRGSLHSIPGTGPLNGYDDYWRDNCPANGQIYLISSLDVVKMETTTLWYDGAMHAYDNTDTSAVAYCLVCEVQDEIMTTTTTTTEAPPATTTTALPEVVVPWAQDHWYAILLAMLLPLLAAIVLTVVIIFCCCRRRTDDESTRVASMELREVKGNVYETQQRQNGGVSVSEDPVLLTGRTHEQKLFLEWNSSISPSQCAAPVESSPRLVSASVASQSSRLSRNHSRRRVASGTFAGGDFSRGEGIAEDADGASVGNTRRVRRVVTSRNVVHRDDLETMESR
ncbi:hypothetical protein TraAM80_10381 [Trypanosoma rangeli]|uniref:Uncharacterized protein n=1 Tax=Trypanosoma rangeli TaxID=5698 RepID=A0A422MPN3_TRYRA|nr:uncharacterized protein TraAM80_10381 [Trypanosoma rangeli]RNE95133.1 hypothetical protein TraAM80_10381 [Trypanosoma rangeli]|eukprot:RNE95133.1 hypothetical protein TraAM80_10381 [Trypanosoma rangeli]